MPPPRRRTSHSALLLALALASCAAPALHAQNFSEVRPSPQQDHWQDLEMGAIFHFGTNTFLNREWGDGTAPPSVFNPKHVDTDQWIAAAKSAGIRYVVFVAKHHDGFALWPTAQTSYSVKSSPWLGGKGDLVRMVSDSARSAGLGFGVYESPWDRHDPRYKDPAAYDTFYLSELVELASNYGPLTEFWLDGAGSAGRTYNFDKIIQHLRTYQSNTLVFADVDLYKYADIRWVGTESGDVDFPVWNAVDNTGYLRWRPVEADTPLHKGQWFWHPDSDSTLKSLPELLREYDNTVGHGAQLMLGLAPNTDGVLPAADVVRLREFGERLRAIYGDNLLAHHASLSAEEERAVDDNPDTWWAAGEEPATLTVRLDHPTRFDRFMTTERLQDGQHIERYALDAEIGGKWQTLVQGEVIGHKRIDLLPEPVEASAVRLRILAANGPAEIRGFGIYMDAAADGR